MYRVGIDDEGSVTPDFHQFKIFLSKADPCSQNDTRQGADDGDQPSFDEKDFPYNDTIAGGAGNDTMSGGAGNNTFVFRANLGQDVVTDFTVGSDLLEFRDGNFADAAAALAAAPSSGSDTLITIDANNTVLLKNVSLANLHETDFHIM